MTINAIKSTDKFADTSFNEIHANLIKFSIYLGTLRFKIQVSSFPLTDFTNDTTKTIKHRC